MPACKEDENLFRQFPGCPFTGEGKPAPKETPRAAAPWQHDKQPILPVSPDQGVIPGDGDEVKPADTEQFSGKDDQRPQAANSAGSIRHTSLKWFTNRNSDNPVRQKVDTLEVRPSDLNRDEKRAD
jgi:hypothetical protein